mmetsp:Transcript_12201/g.18895  ORF Transcript_12201/g.18895 Transcript_12201/m.18895 type:complete len:372 (-) Transcript_12201:247-1362(-)
MKILRNNDERFTRKEKHVHALFVLCMLLGFGGFVFQDERAGDYWLSPELAVKGPNSKLTSEREVFRGNFSYLPKGKWVWEGPHKTFLASICCGWDGNNFLKHPKECGKESMPKHEGGYTGRKKFLAHMGGNACSCPKFKDEWSWSSPTLKKHSAEQTCRKLGNRSVLMIGDSTMEQTASTLMNALHFSGCQTQITFMPGDTLVGKNMGNYNRGREWVDSVLKSSPDIVVLSAGSHVYNKSNYEFVLDHVINGTKFLKGSSMPNLQVAWKTQQPGGCTENITTEISSAGTMNAPESVKRYNYPESYERDMYALSQFPFHGIHTIDMRMLYFRSDAHITPSDCLHMCSPGPLDVIAPLFSDLLDKIEHSETTV